jgi:hypothetical protein
MFGEDALKKGFKGGIKGLGKGLSGSAPKGKLGHGKKVTSGGKSGGKDKKGCK